MSTRFVDVAAFITLRIQIEFEEMPCKLESTENMCLLKKHPTSGEPLVECLVSVILWSNC